MIVQCPNAYCSSVLVSMHCRGQSHRLLCASIVKFCVSPLKCCYFRISVSQDIYNIFFINEEASCLFCLHLMTKQWRKFIDSSLVWRDYFHQIKHPYHWFLHTLMVEEAALWLVAVNADEVTLGMNGCSNSNTQLEWFQLIIGIMSLWPVYI